MTVITVSAYVRRLGDFSTDITPLLLACKNHDDQIDKKPLGTASYGFNFFDMKNVKGLKVASYKFERRGERYFVSVTFSSHLKKSVAGCAPYLKLLREITGTQNRWQAAKYVMFDGSSTNVALRERMNATMKDGTVRPMLPVTL